MSAYPPPLIETPFQGTGTSAPGERQPYRRRRARWRPSCRHRHPRPPRAKVVLAVIANSSVGSHWLAAADNSTAASLSAGRTSAGSSRAVDRARGHGGQRKDVFPAAVRRQRHGRRVDGLTVGPAPAGRPTQSEKFRTSTSPAIADSGCSPIFTLGTVRCCMPRMGVSLCGTEPAFSAAPPASPTGRLPHGRPACRRDPLDARLDQLPLRRATGVAENHGSSRPAARPSSAGPARDRGGIWASRPHRP